MKTVIAYLKLVRVVNLSIIAATLYSVRYFIIAPYMDAVNLDLNLCTFDFSLLVTAVVFIAAAGNVVNAYFDYEQDWEYRPDTTVVGKYISLNTTFYLQMGLNIIGVLIGFYLARKVGNEKLGYVFLTPAVLLFLYSQLLKQYFFIGNVIVALLSALVVVIPLLFEPRIFSFFHTDSQLTAFRIIVLEIEWYAAFVFLLSLLREIVKDVEDREADTAYHYYTLAVRLPSIGVRLILSALITLLIVMAVVLSVYFCRHRLIGHCYYTSIAVLIPLIALLVGVWMARTATHNRYLSMSIKVLMGIGIASMPLFYYFISRA